MLHSKDILKIVNSQKIFYFFALRFFYKMNVLNPKPFILKVFFYSFFFLILAENLDAESGKRSILIGGFTRDISVDKVISAFQKLEITGGGQIQAFDFFDNDKIRITYLNRQGNLL